MKQNMTVYADAAVVGAARDGTVRVTAMEMDLINFFSQLNAYQVTKAFGISNLLDAIGEEAVRKYFGIGEE